MGLCEQCPHSGSLHLCWLVNESSHQPPVFHQTPPPVSRLSHSGLMHHVSPGLEPHLVQSQCSMYYLCKEITPQRSQGEPHAPSQRPLPVLHLSFVLPGTRDSISLWLLQTPLPRREGWVHTAHHGTPHGRGSVAICLVLTETTPAGTLASCGSVWGLNLISPRTSPFSSPFCTLPKTQHQFGGAPLLLPQLLTLGAPQSPAQPKGGRRGPGHDIHAVCS